MLQTPAASDLALLAPDDDLLAAYLGAIDRLAQLRAVLFSRGALLRRAASASEFFRRAVARRTAAARGG